MYNFALAFVICGVVYFIGEAVSNLTKAWIPSVFVTAAVLLVGFWTVIPTTVVSDSMLIPFGILLGLRGGMFTATEAGAICAWYSLFIGVVIYKEIKWSHIWTILKESVLGTATVMILICAAGALSYFMTYERVPQALAETMLSMNLTKVSFLLMTNVILLIIGMFMDITPAILIFTPIFLPIAQSFGMSDIQFGVMLIFNMCLGNITPPVGSVLFVGCGIGHVSIEEVTPKLIPYFLVLIVMLLLVTFVPGLSLGVPSLMGLV